VRWPSGTVDQVGKQGADQQLVIVEGKGLVSQQPIAPSKVSR
jgi:hypothetical protein